MSKGTVNKVILIGRLGNDPEVRMTAGGMAVANISLATNEIGPKDQNGQRQEFTEWHRLTLFGKTAEIAGQYLTKGSQIYAEGRLQTKKYADQQGVEKYSTTIVVNQMTMLGGGSQDPSQKNTSQQYQSTQQGQNGSHGGNQRQQWPGMAQGNPGPGMGPANIPAFDDFDDDLPF